jgi:hypothetical protein
MAIRFGSIALAAVAAEVTGVLVLVVLVALFGPPGLEAAQPFAERLGAWVGPLSGFTLCLAAGYWVARGAGPDAVRNGVALGMAAAALDLATAFALGAGPELLLLVSNAGRVAGGALGGGLALRRARRGPSVVRQHERSSS